MSGGERSPRRCTSRSAEAEMAAAAAGAAGVKNNRLTAKEVRWFLAQKPTPPPARYQALKRSNPELMPLPGEEQDEDKRRLYFLARAFYDVMERLPKLQERVRRELEEKGYVEVDDEYHKRRAEAQAVVDREWPEIEAKVRAIRLSQGFDDDDESESDSDSDSEEEDDDE